MNNKNLSPTICMLPFSSINIHATGKLVRCQMSEVAMGDVVNGSIVDQWDNDAFRELRQNQIDGVWNPGCINCLQKEAEGIKSKRLHWHDLQLVKDAWKTKDFANSVVGNDIIHLDIAFNNICNFKCRMCSSAYSNAWIPDERKLKEAGIVGGSGGLYPKLATVYNREKNQLSSEQVHEILDRAPNLRRVEILGGEPFLAPEYSLFIDELKRRGMHENLELMITTNGSVISDAQLEQLLGFKYVNINFSLDATGDLFSYMRSAGLVDWDHIDRQIDRVTAWCDAANQRGDGRYKININGAYQIYNMLNLAEFIEYIVKKFKWDISAPDPNSKFRNSFEHRIVINAKLTAGIAPEALCDESILQLDYLYEKYPFLATIDESKYLNDIRRICTAAKYETKESLRQERQQIFLNFTRALDRIRNTSTADVIPDVIAHFPEFTSDVPMPEPLWTLQPKDDKKSYHIEDDPIYLFNCWKKFYLRRLYTALLEGDLFERYGVKAIKQPYDELIYRQKITEFKVRMDGLDVESLLGNHFYKMFYRIPDRLDQLARQVRKEREIGL